MKGSPFAILLSGTIYTLAVLTGCGGQQRHDLSSGLISGGPGMVGSRAASANSRRSEPPKPGILEGTLQNAVPSANQACTVPGGWLNTYGGVISVNQDLSGSMQLPYCSSPHALAISLQGTTGFFVQATWSGGSECQSFTENLTFSSACNTASGTYVNADGTNGNDTWTKNSTVQVTLSRQSLTVVQANGTPAGGTFAYTTTPVSGSNFATIDFASGFSATSNPNDTNLTGPLGSGAPTPGGLENITAQYTVNGTTASDTFQVPTFGMSCYIIALESDYGTPPDACSSTTIYGVHYTGALTNPNGLVGTYCASFIGNVKLQGSAQLNSGQDVQYNVSTQKIVQVSAIKGSDGTPVVAGQTVARDRAIIPAKGVLVDVDQVGVGLLANDTGGAIKGYRLDLFNGAGIAACDTYSNPIGVSACETPQPNCPGRTLQ